jgi:hypothetical protein
MNPSEFLDVLERLYRRLQVTRGAGRGIRVLGKAEKLNVRSVVGAWFGEYQPSFVQMIGENDPQIRVMDELVMDLLQLTSGDNARRTVVQSVLRAVRHFKETLLVRISRAYWSRVPQRSPAGLDEEVGRRLRSVDAKVADGYEQAVLDIEALDRLSYRGAAAELREVLTHVLHLLAPTSKVAATDWYKEARRSGHLTETKPTRAERTRFILRSQSQGATVTESAESYMVMVEDRLGHVIGRTFERGNAATHAGTEREELVKLLPYINALLRELLPQAGPTPTIGHT